MLTEKDSDLFGKKFREQVDSVKTKKESLKALEIDVKEPSNSTSKGGFIDQKRGTQLPF